MEYDYSCMGYEIAGGLGAHVITCKTYADFVQALKIVQQTDRTSVIYIQNDRYAGVPGYEGWWDVPVVEVSTLPSVQEARSMEHRPSA